MTIAADGGKARQIPSTTPHKSFQEIVEMLIKKFVKLIKVTYVKLTNIIALSGGDWTCPLRWVISSTLTTPVHLCDRASIQGNQAR